MSRVTVLCAVVLWISCVERQPSDRPVTSSPSQERVETAATATATDNPALYIVPENIETRWASFENHTAGKGAGGMENKGAKGHAMD
jgi:hypothetical protein